MKKNIYMATKCKLTMAMTNKHSLIYYMCAHMCKIYELATTKIVGCRIVYRTCFLEDTCIFLPLMKNSFFC